MLRKINNILKDKEKIEKIHNAIKEQQAQGDFNMMKTLPEKIIQNLDKENIYQHENIKNMTNFAQFSIGETTSILAILAGQKIHIILHTYNIADGKLANNQYEILKTVELEYIQDLKIWEESLKYESKINKEKARFFADMYEKNFNNPIVEQFQVLDFGLVTVEVEQNMLDMDGDNNKDDIENIVLEEDIGIIVGGNFGIIYSIPLSDCFEKENKFYIEKFYQCHMNTITSLKCLNCNDIQGKDIVLSASKDALIKISNIYSQQNLFVIQESNSLYQGTTILSVDWSQDGMKIMASGMCGTVYIWDLKKGNEYDHRKLIDQSSKRELDSSIKLPKVIKHSVFSNSKIHNDQVNCFIDQVAFCDNYGQVTKDIHGNIFKWIYEPDSHAHHLQQQQGTPILSLGGFHSGIEKLEWHRSFGICQQNQILYIGNDKGQIIGYILEDICYQKKNSEDKYQNKEIACYNVGDVIKNKFIKKVLVPKYVQFSQDGGQEQGQVGYAMTCDSLIFFPLIQLD